MKHREVSLRSLQKKPFAGETGGPPGHHMRPVDAVSGYTGFLPGLQNTVAAAYPTLAKMSASYSSEYRKTVESRTAVSPNNSSSSGHNPTPSPQPQPTSPPAPSPRAVVERSVPRASSAATSTPTRAAKATSSPPRAAGGYTGYRPGRLHEYGTQRRD